MNQQNNIRLLAAVMFADIVGYSKMMHEDEQNAKLLRDRQRAVIKDLLLKYHGEVMQYYGDGTLMMFGSALDAVNCARDIQRELNNQPLVPLRIGIHMGDVMYDDEGIYGDAVNIAARVQGLGLPGSVMLSEKVVDEIKNQPGFRFESFGKHELKNIYMPIGIHAVADEGFNVPTQSYVQKLTGTNHNSIAVLPFTNYSREKDTEYFSDGITEEIINALTTIKDLKVASRTSVFAYKKEIKDVREIGKELNVSTVLEGSVRKVGNKIRVTAQLINADDGFHIWSNNFDGDMQDIFAFQDEIARKIVDKLEDSLSDQDKKKIYESSTNSVEAYNYYLQGLYYWNKRTPEAVFKAIDYFDRAIEECDTYVNAMASLANCYTFLGTIGHMQSKLAFMIAEKHALMAIELNNTRADSYIALGYVNLLFKWDFNSAEANFRKAITMEPDNSEARQALSLYYRIIGDYDKMLDQADAAVKIDPLSLPALLESGRAHWVMGKYEKALNAFNEALELDKMFRAAYEGKAAVYASQKKYDKALRMIKKYAKLIDSKYRGASQLAYIYAEMGDKVLAEENINRLKEREKEEPNHNLSLDFAMVYAALGNNDLAFEYLQKAVDAKLGGVLLIHSLPFIKDLKDDPHYKEIEGQLGLANEKIGINK
ncbi:adenylate/guanylate cyclase domain-containing protein [Rhodohalobacter sulfatireducens]|uniref:Tetratricopeptide repeat protein n=1 Tax=Rhodohalobacter sulfatireducens TaxID=2911366 RepID=A0ABS9K8M6_9BACT|nr:adenylate/guanylate cyclase domain-containing protein [Rhodohalobacter sulfatireducens]MCG2587209.1 tetratricopeptide repeat protein [Rhodohalobacter sulfatireducens]